MDPDWLAGSVSKTITYQFEGGSTHALARFVNYDLVRPDGTAGYTDDLTSAVSAFPISVSPGATAGALPKTENGDTKRFVLLAYSGQTVSGELPAPEPYSAGTRTWQRSGAIWTIVSQTADPHLEVTDQPSFRLSLIDEHGRSVTDGTFRAHLCPRFDHESPQGQPCTSYADSDAQGIVQSVSLTKGYLGLELTKAPFTPGVYYVKVESLGQNYRIRRESDFVTDGDVAAGEFKGAFALCVVEAGEFLDQNFQRVNPYEVEQDTTAYFRYSNGGESPTATVTLQSKAEENATRVDTIDMPINRLGQSRTYLAGPFTLRPGLTGGAGGQLRGTRPLVSGDPALVVFPSFTDLFGLFGSKRVGSGFAIVPRKLRIDYLDENGQPQSPLLPPTVRVERLPDQPPYQNHNLYAEKTQVRVVATLPGTNEIDTTASGYAMLAEQPNTLLDPLKQLSYQGEKNATATRLSVFADPQIADPTASNGQIPIVGGQSPLIKLYSLAGPREDVNLTAQQTAWTAKLIARPTTVNVPRDFKDSIVNLIPQWSDQGSYGLAAGASQSSFTANPSGSGLPDWLEALSWDVIGQMRQGVGQTDSYAQQVGLAVLDVKAPEAGCSIPWYAFVCSYQQTIRYDTRYFRTDKLRVDSFNNTIYHGLLASTEHFMTSNVQHEARHCWQNTQPDNSDLDKLPDSFLDAAEQARALYLLDSPNTSRAGGLNPEFDFRGSGQADNQGSDEIAIRNDALERDAMRWEARNADLVLGSGADCVEIIPTLLQSSSPSTPIYDLGTGTTVAVDVRAKAESYNVITGQPELLLSGVLVGIQSQTDPVPGETATGNAAAQVTDPRSGLAVQSTVAVTGNLGVAFFTARPASGLNIYRVTIRHPNAAGDGAGALMHACGFPDGPMYFKVRGN